MRKKDTRRRIINPETGRKVLLTGDAGMRIRAQKTRVKSSGASKPNKKAQKPRNVTCVGGTCKKPIKHGIATVPSVARKTETFAAHPHALPGVDTGACGPFVYEGRLHVMTFDTLGRHNWQVI